MSIPSFLTNVAKKALNTAKNNPVKTGAATTLSGATLLNYLMGGGTPQGQASSEVGSSILKLPMTGGLKQISGPAAPIKVTPESAQNSTLYDRGPAPAPQNNYAPSAAPTAPVAYGQANPAMGGTQTQPVMQPNNMYTEIAKLQQQRADDYLNRAGLYSNAGVPLSPSQEAGIRGSADNVYSEKIAQKVGEANIMKANPTNALVNNLMGGSGFQGSGVPADQYITGLLSLPKIGSSQDDTNRILSVLRTQDPATRQGTIKTLVRNNMGIDDKNLFDNNEKFSQQSNYITSQYSDVLNNPYQYIGQNLVTYFGGEKSPEYNDFKSNVSSLIIPLRKDFFGASLTPNEQASANQLVPDFEVDDTPTIMQKLQNIADLSEYSNLQKINKTLNIPTPSFTTYKSRKEAIRNGYSEEEIDAFEKTQAPAPTSATDNNRFMSANIDIPDTSRLSNVNNNPGNLRFAQQNGATQGEGGFARFASPNAGLMALSNQVALDTSRGHTLSSFINKFAPPTENNTNQYITQASAKLGFSPDTPLSKIPHDELVKFIALKESGTKLS